MIDIKNKLRDYVVINIVRAPPCTVTRAAAINTQPKLAGGGVVDCGVIPQAAAWNNNTYSGMLIRQLFSAVV